MKPPIIVTGHGRSGTHWVANVLGHFVEAHHEPEELHGDVVVDCRLHGRRPLAELAKEHRIIHLVRDGREVVRSAYEFYGGRYSFEETCEGWAMVLDRCRDYPVVRLEDLTRRIAPSAGHRLSHWRNWPEDIHETFWRICGEHMRRYGYSEHEGNRPPPLRP